MPPAERSAVCDIPVEPHPPYHDIGCKLLEIRGFLFCSHVAHKQGLHFNADKIYGIRLGSVYELEKTTSILI